MTKRFAAPLALVALCAGGPAGAQNLRVEPGTPGTAAATSACELHAWPASNLRSTYHGWFHGGITDGAVQGRDGYEKLPPNPLSTATQVERLRASPLAEILALPGYEIVVHDEALTSVAIQRTKGRHIADSPPCYAELVTDDVFFQQDIVNGRFLKVLFRFRLFDGSDTPAVTFGTYSQRKLKLFPPEKEAQKEASFDELADQYSEAIGEFGLALNPPPKEKEKRGNRARS